MTLETQTLQDGHWWASRWRYLLRELDLEVSESEMGLRVKRIEVTPGHISADVKVGKAQQVCVVDVRLHTWQDAEWQAAVEALSRQALYAARLLAGNLPPDLERGLAEAGLALLPQRRSDLAAACSCCGATNTACPHVRVVFAALGDLLAEDPWLLFRLRGRDQAQVLRDLRKTRAQSTEGMPSRPANGVPDVESAEPGFYRAGGGNGVNEVAPSLENDLHAFWGKAKAQESFHAQVARPVVELALLRRLGPPEFAGGTGELFDKLAEVYRRVTEEGLALAYAADPAGPVNEVEESV